VRQGLILLVAVVTACASAGPPPGGPEDKVPPQLVRVTPDTNAVNVSEKFAKFYFDETVNDRGTGAQEIDAHFLVSPSDGFATVEWHRSRIDVRPRHGFRANTAYTITLLPGLTDLQNNVMKTGATLVFSTGPVIPPYRIKGIIFDWIAEHPAPLGYIEAVSPDSTVYLAQADTGGRFSIGPLNPGSYLVRGILDVNNNRALDRNESFDTVRVSVPQPTAQVELLAAPRDTLPVRLLTVTASDSVTLRITFDRSVDPTKPVTPATFRLLASDSTVIPISAVLSPLQERQADSVARLVAVDSTRRADSLARRADSIAGKPLTPVAPVRPPEVVAPVSGAKPPPPPPPKPSQPTPFATVTVKVGKTLAFNAEYRLTATGLLSLSGRTQESERRFTTPKPAPPPKVDKDSAAARPPARDSAAARTARPPAKPPVRR
jgi:Bacterial Ig-like domain